MTVTLSLETGKRIVVDENWSITPQAQLAYSNVDFDDFTDPFGADVSLGRGDSLKGRIGHSADYQNAWEDGAGKMTRTNLYGSKSLSAYGIRAAPAFHLQSIQLVSYTPGLGSLQQNGVEALN